MSAKSTGREALAADWLGACRRAGAAVERVLDRHASMRERAVTAGPGAGGDVSLVIDREAEDAVFAELATVHGQGHSFIAVSEERGEVSFGDGTSRVRVVIDPVDGSLNAKRLIPVHSLSIAVSGGETMEDVELAYVYDYGAREEFVARLGEGAILNGEPVEPEEHGRGLEVVGFEAARPEWVAPVAARLEGRVYRMRVIGSIAVSLCYLAVARFDGVLTANVCRSFDVAAAQLVAREAGAFVSVLGHGGIEAPLDMETRFRFAAARTPEDLETLVRALTEAGLPPG